MISTVKKLIHAIESNELSKNILYIEGETNRLTFFTLFVLRVQLAFLLRNILPSLPVFTIVLFYLMYNLFVSRFKNLRFKGTVIAVFPALVITFFLLELLKVQFFGTFYIPPDLMMRDPSFLTLPLVQFVRVIVILNICKAALFSTLTLLTVLFFSVIPGGAVKDSFSITTKDVFEGKSLSYHLFTFAGKTGRIAYLYASLSIGLILNGLFNVYLLALVILNFDKVLDAFAGNIPSFTQTYKEVTLLYAAVLTILGLWAFFGITIKRLHHLGKSGFLSLLLVPLFLLHVVLHPLVLNYVYPRVFSAFGSLQMVSFSLYGRSFLYFMGMFVSFTFSAFIVYLTFGHGEGEGEAVPGTSPADAVQPVESVE